MGRLNLPGGQINLLGGQMPTQLTCYFPPCSIEWSLVDKTLCKKLLSFQEEMIAAKFFRGNVLLLRKTIQTLNIFESESALYMKSVGIHV